MRSQRVFVYAIQLKSLEFATQNKRLYQSPNRAFNNIAIEPKYQQESISFLFPI